MVKAARLRALKAVLRAAVELQGGGQVPELRPRRLQVSSRSKARGPRRPAPGHRRRTLPVRSARRGARATGCFNLTRRTSFRALHCPTMRVDDCVEINQAGSRRLFIHEVISRRDAARPGSAKDAR